jgi:hypothetical protein
LEHATGSLDSAQSRQLKFLLGNSLQRAAVSFLEGNVFSTSFEPVADAAAQENLRRMCCLVLRSSSTEFLCKAQTPLLLDGSEDERLQGELVSALFLEIFAFSF